jgi:hypothetical protein
MPTEARVAEREESNKKIRRALSDGFAYSIMSGPFTP